MDALYVPGGSLLHRADPRLKLLAAPLWAAVLLSYNNLWVMSAIVAALVLLYLACGIPAGTLKLVARLVAPVAILIPLLWPLFYRSGPVLFAPFGLSITAWTLAQGLAASVRIVGLAYLGAGVLMTTSMRALLRALVELRLPYEAALAVTIALSYIPRLQRIYEQVTEAQLARGLDLSSGGFRRRAQRRVPILVATLVTALRSADVLARALECRGFGRKGVRRTSLFQIRWQRLDTVLALATAAACAALLFLRARYGFGAHPLFLH